MIDRLKPFRACVESGLECLGEVPAHWEVRQLGQFGAFSKGSGGNKQDEVPTGIPCVRYGDLYTTHEYFIQKSRSFVSSEKAQEYTPIRYGDVLFAASGETIEEIGKSAVNLIQSDARCGGDIVLFRPKREMEARYLGYAADCAPAAIQKATMGRGITVIHIYTDQLKRLSVTLPPLPEQTAIARFLDHADWRIRRYIRAKEKLIALLEEQKQAIIHQAVTGRIDVRTGQPYPAYMPSGVEWLGDLPAHWEARRLKTVCRIRYGLGQPPPELPDGLPLIRATNVSKGQILDKDLLYVDPSAVPNSREAILKEKEIIVVRSGAYTADSAIIPKCYAGSITGYDMVVTAIGVQPEFVAIALLCSYLRDDQLITQSTRSAQPHLNAEELGSSVLLLPPLSEQIAIVDRLDKETAAIADHTENANQQIDLLREYRTRLIADVVTGNLDVREAAAALPEVDPLPADDEAADPVDTSDLPAYDDDEAPAEVVG